MIAAFSLLAVLLFWAAVAFGYFVYEWRNNPEGLVAAQRIFNSRPLEDEDAEDREERRQEEERDLRDDLEDRARVPRTLAGADDSEQLVNLGIAENTTATHRDEDNEIPGELWLCSGRPLFFAGAQLVLGYLLALPFYYAATSPVIGQAPTNSLIALCVLVSQLLVTGFLAYLSYYTVAERTRMGVKRFGAQLLGYLRPGLQFKLPLIEEFEEIPLQSLVWGPHDADAHDSNHIGGVSGENNAEPGKLTVKLRGRWDLKVAVQITVRFRMSRKDAWYDALNRYHDATEIGEQIAGVVNSVFFTRAREISHNSIVEALAEIQGRTVDEVEAEFNQEDSAKIETQALAVFLHQIPEIAGEILHALQHLGYARLGGILPISVATTNVTPGPELAELMQVEDRAVIRRYEQQLAGEATRLRSEELLKVLRDLPAGLHASFLQLSDLDVRRVFAQAGNDAGSLESLLRVFLANLSPQPNSSN